MINEIKNLATEKCKEAPLIKLQALPVAKKQKSVRNAPACQSWACPDREGQGKVSAAIRGCLVTVRGRARPPQAHKFKDGGGEKVTLSNTL